MSAVALAGFVVVIAVGSFIAIRAGVDALSAPAANPYARFNPSAGLDRYLEPEARHAGDHWASLSNVLERSIGNQIRRTRRGDALAIQLSRADLRLKVTEWMVGNLIIGGLFGELLAWRFGSLIAIPAGLVIELGAARMFLTHRLKRRTRLFEAQLGPTVLALRNATRAGHAFSSAMQFVAEDAPWPIGDELRRTAREVSLGLPAAQAYANLVERNQSEDLALLMLAVSVQSQVGGNLAEILHTIELTIRERVRIHGEIRTLTAQARASGWVLMALPPGLALFLSLLAPSYFRVMFSPIGAVIFGVSAFMMGVGYAVIRKIVSVDV